jgi:MFS transporter, DHA2 family, multidrug resistance protein
MGYPAKIAGLVTAPSGFGTMLAMLVVGRMVGRIDLRVLLAIGFSLTACSLWQMSGYTLTLTQSNIVWPGVVQGIGLGLVFVPLSAATFATLSPDMRAEGTAIYSLMRNIGSSIGIALVQALLVRNTQIAHASLVEKISYANPALQDTAIASVYNLANSAGLETLNDEITRQASMIAYVDDFWFMLVLTLLVLPLLLLIRPPRTSTPLSIDHAAME